MATVILAAVLLLVPRWLPVPTSSFMLQWQWQHRDDDRALSYRWIDLEDVSIDFVMGVIAAEDQNFPNHHGVDLTAIRKAIEERLDNGRLRGASTITQQVVKNLYLWPGTNFLRKVLEAPLSLAVDGLWPKRRILEVYVNIVELGDGIYGISAAAGHYFNRRAADLEQSQSYALAAMLPSPKRSDPLDPSAAHRKRIRHIEIQVRQLGGPGYLDGILKREIR